jgi:ADP-ribosylglycohydrolase
MSPTLESKFAGALFGCAVGDALGAPFEGRSQGEMAPVKDIVTDFRKIHGYPSGQYTDDTQLTIALAETYIECKGFSGEDFGNRVARLWATREIVGAGGACTYAARNLIQGMDWTEAGAPDGQAGNGAAMRASPAGLFRHNHLDLLLEESMDQSRVTHQDTRAGAGAAAVSFAVAWNLADKAAEPEKFCRELSDFIIRAQEEFAAYIRRLPEWLEKETTAAVPEMACAGWIDPPRPLGVITPFVIPTVLASLWVFLQHPDDYCAAVDKVIRLGGDVDTTAAITGAIVGARVGEQGIPEDLREGVLDAERIAVMARDLYEKAQGNEP